MKTILTEIEINAAAEKVWRILTDFEKFPAWNPFVTSIAGKPAVGETLKITVKVPEKQTLQFTPKVLRAAPNEELRWVGAMPLGAFRGEHFFKIEALGDDKIRFTHGEIFNGWTVWLIGFLMGKQLEKGYRLMNEALKEQAENV